MITGAAGGGEAAAIAGAVGTLAGFIVLGPVAVRPAAAVSATVAADQHWRVGSRVPVVYPDGTRARLRVATIFALPDVTVFGTLGGVILGTFLGWAVVASSGSATLAVFAAPPLQLVLFLVLGAVTGILAGIRPARRAARLT